MVTPTIETLDQIIAEARLSRSLPEPALRRLLRERAGLSQEQIAGVMGVSRPAVTRWETGVRTPRGSTRVAYARLLDRLIQETATGALNDRNPAGKPGLGETTSGVGAAGHVLSG